MTQDNEFAGAWKSTLGYPTKDDTKEETSTYDMVVYQTGHDLVVQSKPTDDGSYLLVRLSIDGDIATGTWYEHTSPEGEFAAAMYSGAGQLIISGDKRHLEGKWAGAGMDHQTNELRIYTGQWSFERV